VDSQRKYAGGLNQDRDDETLTSHARRMYYGDGPNRKPQRNRSWLDRHARWPESGRSRPEAGFFAQQREHLFNQCIGCDAVLLA
jgi:hypothetical protein